jgi:hypothetical protein
LVDLILIFGVLVVEEAGEKHRPWASNWQTLSLVVKIFESILYLNI